MRRAAPHSRRCRAISSRRRPLAALASLVALLPLAAAAQSPAAHSTPSPSPHPGVRPTQRPVRVDVTKIQPKSLLPKHAEHAEYVVEVNKLGQVSRVASQRGSDNPVFNAQTYGNALQAFIRTPDGHVVLGTYKLTYDYDPKTTRVRRDVVLVHEGGVDPEAKGAAADMLDRAHVHPITPQIAPANAPNIDPRSLPELKGIMAPSPEPTATH